MGDDVTVEADVFTDGHDAVVAELLWKYASDSEWRHAPMTFLGNDHWTASFRVEQLGRYEYTVHAWTDALLTWQRDLKKREAAGQDLSIDFLIGGALSCNPVLKDAARPASERYATAMSLKPAPPDASQVLVYDKVLEVNVDPVRARFSTWYELFPRSVRGDGTHATFRDLIDFLPEVAAMGFDVLYLPPVHPIGMTERKGKNNALNAKPDDVGSPWAIGAKEGGHKALHPQLGSFADFDALVKAAGKRNIAIALDIAFQCSPDHPYVREHPEWFKQRPDGTVQYAENPPKKYEDIVNPDFYGSDSMGLWTALRDVVLFWVEQGVRIFRVDNPHTKPFPFWEWLIREIQTAEPAVIFLAEAFTRPKVMKALAKLGFTQSYTYFTWRTEKEELQAYLSEITRYPEREYFRPNFFTNTPDILPFHLQSGEPWIFKARVALAATLSGNYGIYNGFELLEHDAVAGREEYLDSEKYEVKVRDWDKPGNIKSYIGHLNWLRRSHPALQQTSRLYFAQIDDAEVIGFVKEAEAGDDAVAVAIALSNSGPHEFWFHFGDIEIGPPGARQRVREIENLTTGTRHTIEWGGVRLRIAPDQDPALLFRCLA